MVFFFYLALTQKRKEATLAVMEMHSEWRGGLSWPLKPFF